MHARKIKSALADIGSEGDPTLKSAKLASLCSALWAEHGVELVVVGGSAIELLTEGAYASGDLDMCQDSGLGRPPWRTGHGLEGGPAVGESARIP